MDDWEKFENQDDSYTRKTYDGSSFSGDRVYTDTAEAPKKPSRQPKDPVYVTRKAFILSLIICVVVSAAVGAGAYALAISTFGGTSVDKSVKSESIIFFSFFLLNFLFTMLPPIYIVSVYRKM